MNTQDRTLLNQTAETYDNVPYQSKPFPASNPALLKGITQLFGIQATPLNKARVLELGCASGGNLIPLAYFYPDIELVGVDLSEVQVKQGQALIQELGLESRVSLHHMSVTDIPESFGKFDYILCHGVYSWVPDFVQDSILSVMQNHLSDNGLAYISYNIYPGWKTLEIARDSMLFHTRHIPSGDEKVKHARVMINFMQQHAKEGTIYKQIMSDAQTLMQKSADYYIAHEFLEIHNSPCYFLEMIERAEQHDLAYVSDSNIATVFSENWGEEARDELLKASGNNQIVLEQYLDYMTNRQFRQSIFVKNNQKDKISRTVSLEKIKNLNFSLHIEKESTVRAETPDLTYFIFKQDPNSYYRTKDPALIKYLKGLLGFNHKIFNHAEYESVLKKELGESYNEQSSLLLLQHLLILGLIAPYSEPALMNISEKQLPKKPLISEFNRIAAKSRHYLVNSNLSSVGLDSAAAVLI